MVAAARILGAAPLHDSRDAQQYVNSVGQAIATKSGATYRWRFGLLQTESINAFATPGGFVFVTSGLVRQMETEDELAFVMAHEIAHVVKRHHYRVVQRQRLTERAAKGLQSASGEAANTELSHASAQMYARGLDRSSEYEADRTAIELATLAGYDPAAALSVLERLQRLRGDDPRAELLFSTHPSPGERLDMVLQSGLESLPRPSAEGVARRSARFKSFLRGL